MRLRERPANVTSPELGRSMPAMIRNNVDLPERRGPHTPTKSPSSIPNETRSRTTASRRPSTRCFDTSLSESSDDIAVTPLQGHQTEDRVAGFDQPRQLSLDPMSRRFTDQPHHRAPQRTSVHDPILERHVRSEQRTLVIVHGHHE